MVQRIALVLFTLATLLGASWLAALAIVSCDIMAGALAMSRLPDIDFQKNYGRWGQVECSGGYVCDDNGLCCTRCVNLDDGELLIRCHNLYPVDEMKDALGF